MQSHKNPSLEELNKAYIQLIQQLVQKHNISTFNSPISQLFSSPSPSKVIEILNKLNSQKYQNKLIQHDQNTLTSPVVNSYTPIIDDPKAYRTPSKNENLFSGKLQQSQSYTKGEKKEKIQGIIEGLVNIFKFNQRKVDRYEQISTQTTIQPTTVLKKY